MTGQGARSIREWLILAAIVGVGAVLRLWTIGDGVPYAIGLDEPEIVERSVRMMTTGDFHPKFFDYPGFYLYFQLGVACLRFLYGTLSAEWITLGHVAPADFYLWARISTAMLGITTIVVVYYAGRRWSRAAGLFAAAALALQPLHVRESHFALTDTPLTLLVALTLAIALRAAEDGRLRWFALAGLVAGLAAATKYNGVFALVTPIVVALVSPAVTLRIAAVLTACLAAAGGFLAGAPYTVLDLPGFLNAFGRLAQQYAIDKPAWAAAVTYFKHLRNSFGWPGWLPPMVAWPALLLILTGLVAILRSARDPQRRAMVAALVVFPVTYYWLIANQSLVFGRYTLPLLPHLAVAFGVGAAAVRAWLMRSSWSPRARTAVAAALVLVVAGPPVSQAVSFDLEQAKVGTSELTYQWLSANIPRDQLVIIESTAVRLPPGRYRSENTLKLISRSIEDYRKSGVAYLVASSMEYDKFLDHPTVFPNQVAQYQEIFARTEPVATITPDPRRHPGATYRILKIVPDR